MSENPTLAALESLAGRRGAAEIAGALAEVVVQGVTALGGSIGAPARIAVPVGLGSDTGGGSTAVASPSGDGWAVSGSFAEFTAAAEGSGTLVFVPTDGSSPAGAVILLGDGRSAHFTADAVVAELDLDAAAALATLIRVAIASALVAVTDTVGRVELEHLAGLRERRAGRWAGQALKHEAADVTMARDVAEIHLAHAIEVGESTDRARALSCMAVLEAITAATGALAAGRRLALEADDPEARSTVAACRSLTEELEDAVGGPVGLRAAVFRSAVERVP